MGERANRKELDERRALIEGIQHEAKERRTESEYEIKRRAEESKKCLRARYEFEIDPPKDKDMCRTCGGKGVVFQGDTPKRCTCCDGKGRH